MKRLASVLVLLGVVGTGRANDEAIVKRLEAAGVEVLGPTGELAVIVEANTDLDGALAELCELRTLRRLVFMNRPGLTDSQMHQVCALPGVRYLYFVGCPITDARLKIVARVRGLETLYLANLAITDAGLAELTRCGNLKRLRLKGANFTDAGLRHLEGMKDLRHLEISNCPNITPGGSARLQKALPNCEIRR